MCSLVEETPNQTNDILMVQNPQPLQIKNPATKVKSGQIFNSVFMMEEIDLWDCTGFLSAYGQIRGLAVLLWLLLLLSRCCRCCF